MLSGCPGGCFTLWNPPLWGEGCTTEWTQSNRFSALANLAMVSQRPEVLRHDQRELQAWNHYLSSIAPQREL
jgi:hypothetical protein